MPVVATLDGMSEELGDSREPAGPERSWITRADLVSRLPRTHTDPGLRADLASLAEETTDDLGPIR
jgi:hypothetical protein